MDLVRVQAAVFGAAAVALTWALVVDVDGTSEAATAGRAAAADHSTDCAQAGPSMAASRTMVRCAAVEAPGYVGSSTEDRSSVEASVAGGRNGVEAASRSRA